VPDLKLNLKFEIEMLAKTLKVELADIHPTRKLVHRQQDRAQTCDFANRAGPAAGSLSAAPGGFGGIGGGFGSAAAPAFGMPPTDAVSQQAPFSTQMHPQHLQPPPPPPPPTQPSVFGSAPAAAAQFGNNAAAFFAQQQAQQLQQQQLQQAQAQQQQQQGGGAAALSAHLAAEAESRSGSEGTVIPNLSSYVQINPGLYSQQPQLKRVVPLALDRAIREIISPVVERSVTISCVTTRELMLKDFAMEPDEMRMRKAAQLMVSNLAGSLALVTCKEPLRVACANHLRVLLQQAGSIDSQLLEQVVQVCSSDNLELGCTLIEKAATEKAVRDIEEALAPAFAIRRKHREQTGLPYYDMSIFTSGRYPTGLPEALRPKPGGLLPTQRRVYEDFGRIPRGVPVGAQEPQQPLPMGASGVPQPPQPGGMGGALPAGLGGHPGLEAPGLGFGRGQLGGLGGAPAAMSLGFGGAPGAALGGSTGMLPQSPVPASPGQPSPAGGGLTQTEALERLSLLLSKLDMHIVQLAPQGVGIGALPARHELHQLLARVGECVSYCVSRDEVALSMAGTVFKRMYEQAASGGAVGRLATQVNVSVLARIHASCRKVGQFVADLLLYADDDRKLHEEIVLSLLLAHVVAMTELSPRLAKHLASSRTPHSVAFCAWLVRRTMLDEPLVAATEAKELLGALAAIAQQPAPPEGLLRLLDDLRAALAGGGAQGGRLPKPPPLATAVSTGPPPGFVRAPPPEPLDPALARVREQLTPLWTEWLSLCSQQGANERGFVSQLQSAGWLRRDENGERFLRVLTELALSAAHDGAPGSADAAKPPLAMAPLDAYSKLVVLLLKALTPEPTPSGGRDTTPAAVAATAQAQLALLTKVLGALVAHLLRSHAHSAALRLSQHRTEPQGSPPPFNQRAYLRLMGNWMLDLSAPDPSLDTLQPQMLFAFAAALEALRPSRVPGFAFGWLELVAHRAFMPKLLLAKGHKGWPRLQSLLVSLFAFLYPSLSAPRLAPAIKHLYRGALRVLLVLLHDFPEFLCDYHLALCDAIPPTCIQMRNLVLSAFPRNMMLPDPFTPNLKVSGTAKSGAGGGGACGSSPSCFPRLTAAQPVWLTRPPPRLLTHSPSPPSAGRPPPRDLPAAHHPLALHLRPRGRRRARAARRLPHLPRPALPSARHPLPPCSPRRLLPRRRHQRPRAACRGSRYLPRPLRTGSPSRLLPCRMPGGRRRRTLLRRPVPLPQRPGQPAALSEQPHPLLLLRAASPLRRGAGRDAAGANHPRVGRAVDRAPAAPVGSSHHLYRAHQERPLRILVQGFHALRARGGAALRVGGAILHGRGGSRGRCKRTGAGGRRVTSVTPLSRPRSMGGRI
jgi:CCR4-NOT transcription complex subunit 1